MSWEQISSDTKECRCGKGTVTRITDMDDWNRFRYHTVVNCIYCKEEDDQKNRLRLQTETKKSQLLAQARLLAEDRYYEKWMEIFNSLNKKEIWRVLTGGSGYPSLATFYKHVGLDGQDKYLRDVFRKDFPAALKRLGIQDLEIHDLLDEVSRF